MRIAILSDSHDQILHVHRAVQFSNQAGVEMLIHCGDLISPFMLKHLALFTGPIHLIYGNNVGDQHLVSSRCKSMDNIFHHGIFGSVTAGGLKIAFHHYPELAYGVAKTGDYDVVCCGHNHIRAARYMNGCLLLNPGELLGKDNAPGFFILDTTDKSIQHICVGSPMDFETPHTPIIDHVPVQDAPIV